MKGEQAMLDYLLIYGQPRLSCDPPMIIYEAKRKRVAHPCDAEAVRWARNRVPRLYGLHAAEEAYPAAPMTLWRIEPTGRELIWESRPGMAVHAVSGVIPKLPNFGQANRRFKMSKLYRAR